MNRMTLFVPAIAACAAAAMPAGAAAPKQPRTVYIHDVDCAGAAAAAVGLMDGHPGKERDHANAVSRKLAAFAQVSSGPARVTPQEVKRDIESRRQGYLSGLQAPDTAKAGQRRADLDKTIAACTRARAKA